MTIRYFRSPAGEYLGAFDGVDPPEGSLEVATPPVDARQVWAGSDWGPPPAPVFTVSKADIFRRMTDEEWPIYEAARAQMNPREAAIFDYAQFLVSSDAMFPQLMAGFSQAFGAERAGELLAASTL